MTTQTTSPTPEPPVSRRLTRSSTDRVIGGVCGGLGRYIGVDPVVLRVIAIVLVFFGGAGLIAYAAAWLLVPSDDGSKTRFDGRDVARRTGIALGVLVLTVVVAAGGAWGVAIGGGTTTALIVIAAGIALVAGAFTGGLRWLILPAIALALSAGAVAAADIDARGGVGERIYRPLEASDLRAEYHLGMGHLRLDLRDIDLGPGDHRVHLRLGVGQAEVLVPDDLCVSSSADISVGATTVFDRENGGVDHEWQEIRRAPAGEPHLIVDADVGVGQLRIEPTPEGRFGPRPECGNG